MRHIHICRTALAMDGAERGATAGLFDLLGPQTR
jgi:hypothetical protein